MKFTKVDLPRGARETADGDIEIDPCWEAWARVSRRHPKLDASTFRANWERWEAIRSAIPLLRWDDLRGRFVLPKSRR